MASTFGFTLGTVWGARYFRELDPLSVGFYRNLTFFFTFTPYLFLVPAEAWSLISLEHLGLISLASFLAALGMWTSMYAIQVMPVGIFRAVFQSINAIISIGVGWWMFGEVFSWPVLLVIFLISANTFWLGISSHNFPHLKPTKTSFLVPIVLLGGFILVTSFSLVGKVARDLDPVIASVFWECGICVATLIFIGIRYLFTNQGLNLNMSLKKFLGLSMAVFPVTIGSFGMAKAVTIGPFALMSSIATSGILLSAFLSAWLYKEHLERKYYWGLFMTVILIVILRLLQG